MIGHRALGPHRLDRAFFRDEKRLVGVSEDIIHVILVGSRLEHVRVCACAQRRVVMRKSRARGGTVEPHTVATVKTAIYTNTNTNTAAFQAIEENASM